MPVLSLSARGKSKARARDENAPRSRIPVKSASSPCLSQGLGAFVSTAQSPGALEEKPSIRFSDKKSSISFPKTAAPAVVTPASAFVDATGRLNTQQEEPPKPKRRSCPSSTEPKSKPQHGDIKSPESVKQPLWETLLTNDKDVVATTFDRDLLQSADKPYAATMVTPEMLHSGLEVTEVAYHAWAAAKFAIDYRPTRQWNLEHIVSTAMDDYLVALGVKLMEETEGLHFTFVDPSNKCDTEAMVSQALRLMELFAQKGCRRDRIVISIPATEAGVQAAQQLESKYDVRTNLSFVSGLTHAAICAEAGASFVMFSYAAVRLAIAERNISSPFARVLEALCPSTSTKRLADDAIESTAEYFRHNKIGTKVLLTDVECLADILRLDGFDGVVLDTDQSRKAEDSMPPALPARRTTPTEGSLGKVRAREARAAPFYLALNDGAFLSAMPAETRAITQVTLAEGLRKPTSYMHKVLQKMLNHIQYEAEVAHLDSYELEEFYMEEQQEWLRFLQRENDNEELGPVRLNHVGFRMACSLWDQPDTLCPDDIEKSEGEDRTD